MKKSQRLKSCALIFNRKVKLVMKLATVLLVVFQLSVSATALSQARVSLNLKNATIEEFINSMKEQTGRQFLYNASLMKSEERVNVEANDEDFFVLLDRILPSFHLTYDIVNDVVVLKLLPQAQEDEKKDEKWVVIGKVVDTKKVPLPGVEPRSEPPRTGPEVSP